MKITKSMLAIVTIICLGVLLAFLILQPGKSSQVGKSEESHEEGHHEDSGIHMSTDALRQADIQMAPIQPALLVQQLTLSGEITLNSDQLSHVIAPLSGTVSEVKKTLGAPVKKDELLAVVQSRELGELKANYIANSKRVDFAKTILSREESLWKKGISTQQEFITAKRAHVEATLDFDLATQKLRVLGLSAHQISRLAHDSGQLTRLEIRSPLSGTVVEKHLNMGEVKEGNAELFVVADMRNVWAMITVYAKDIATVRKGQTVMVQAPGQSVTQKGVISYISPMIDPKTRSTVARINLTNTNSLWQPGLYIQAKVTERQTQVPLAVKKEALQTIDGITSIFVQQGDEFKAVPVRTGREDASMIEIISGVTAGTVYVAKNAFILKAESKKSEAEHEH